MNRIKKTYHQIKNSVAYGVAGATTVALTATSALAEPTPNVVDEIFAAADLTTLASNQKAVLLVGVVVTMGFIGFKLFKKAGNKIG